MSTHSDKYHTFYTSKEWKSLRESVLRANNYLCAECKSKGIIKIATIGHHIKPIDTHYELRLDFDNIQPLCRECHEVIENRGGDKLTRFIEEWEKI